MSLPDMGKLMIENIRTISAFILFFRDNSKKGKRRMVAADLSKL